MYRLIDVDKKTATGGHIYKLVNSEDEYYQGFGELYISAIDKGVFRGWKAHTEMQSLIFVVSGAAQFHLIFDNGRCETVDLDAASENFQILQIPAGTIYGFRARSSGPAWIANLASMKHSETEVIRPPIDIHNCDWVL